MKSLTGLDRVTSIELNSDLLLLLFFKDFIFFYLGTFICLLFVLLFLFTFQELKTKFSINLNKFKSLREDCMINIHFKIYFSLLLFNGYESKINMANVVSCK